MQKKEKKQAVRKEHVLQKSHRHAGRDCVAGDTVMLTEKQVALLRREGVVK